MRQLFVSIDTLRQVIRVGRITTDTVEGFYPWIAEIIKVEGGWQVFESVDDAETWRNQQ
jgi:hypothetical protein